MYIILITDKYIIQVHQRQGLSSSQDSATSQGEGLLVRVSVSSTSHVVIYQFLEFGGIEDHKLGNVSCSVQLSVCLSESFFSAATT